MKLLLVVAAERIIIDNRSDKVTAINLIEEISAVSFPYLVIKPFLLVSFQKEDGDPEEAEAILVFTVDDQEIARSSFIVDFSGHPRARSVLELSAMIIPKPGRLKICVHMDETRLGDWDIYVTQTSDEQTGQEPSARTATAQTSSRRTTSAVARSKRKARKPGVGKVSNTSRS